MGPMRVYTKADFYVGMGGMLMGYEWGRCERAGIQARFKTVFAVDNWPVAAESCARMTGYRPTVADLFTVDQWVRFHGGDPCWCGSRTQLERCHQTTPPGWQELTPADLRRLCPGGADIIEASPPCMANSNLLPGKVAKTDRYQVLNDLVWRWLWLWLEAFPDHPPRLIIMENVPGIADPQRKRRRRGEDVVEMVEAMLRAYGYASRRTAMDVGKIIGQTFDPTTGRKVRGCSHRPRFLLVARHVATTQAPLLEPFEMPMGTIGDAIGDLPLPIGDTGIPMHRLPKLARRTEERLAFVSAGGDWRDIEGNWKSAPGFTFIPAGSCDVLVPTTAAGCPDPRVDRTAFNNVLRIAGWDEAAPCVTGGNAPTAGGLNAADPRLEEPAFGDVLGVKPFDEQCGTLTGGLSATRGAFSVADPMLPPADGRHTAKYAVGAFDGQARTVTGAARVGSGAAEVADPRLTCAPNGPTLRVARHDQAAPTITGTDGVWSSASVQVADPIPETQTLRNGFFGVQRWQGASDTIHGSLDVHCGPAAVEDPRGEARAGRIIVAPDWRLWRARGTWKPATWNRSMTMKDFLRLMTAPDKGVDGRDLELAGTSEQQRKQIGNMVPPAGAQVYSELFLATLLSSDLGVSVSGGGGIWVREGGVLRWYDTSRQDGRPMGQDEVLA